MMACCLSLAMSARVCYLMPTAAENAPVANVYNILPWEGDGREPQNEVSPERRAYEWFMDSNGFGGEDYVTIKDVKEGALLIDGKPAMTALWINIDRVGLSLADFDALFNDDVATALGNYVKVGGNLYLSKQATRLVSKIGRATWWPNDYQSNGYSDASDEWQMCVHFCTDGNIDNPFHACLKHMENGQSQDELDFVTRFPLTSGEGSYRRTDNNCAWGDWNLYTPGKGGCDPERRTGFENAMNCKVLGSWGHTRGLDYAGFIEFYPATVGEVEYKGTVMVMGLAAYQWGAQNKSEYNVKNLTKGILNYLSDEHPFDYVWSTEPNNAEVGADQTISVEHKDNSTVYWWTNKPDVVSFSAETGESVTVSFAKVATDVVIKALRKGDGKQIRKNAEYPVEKTIFVNPNLQWTHMPDAACVGETGKIATATAAQGTVQYRSLDPAVEIDGDGNLTFKAVKEDVTIEAYVVIDAQEYKISETTHSGAPYVYWVAEKTPAETGLVGVPMDAEAKLQYGPGVVAYECTNCSWQDDKLTFTTAGEAKVKPYVEYYEVKYYGDEKIITVGANETFYTRATTAGKYGTICVERNSYALEGATFFLPVAIVKEDGAVKGLTLEEVTSLTAGQGYFFLANAAEVKVTMLTSDTPLESALAGGKETRGMHGTFEQIPSPESGEANELFLYNNQLRYGAGNFIGEHRAWIKMNELQEWLDENGQQMQVPGRRRVTMAVEQSNSTTGVQNTSGKVQVTKFMQDGQIYILRAGKVYNVNGQLLK